MTERKQAQERFRLVVEASPNGTVLVDAQGHIVLVNAGAEKLFGYGREELIGQGIELLVPERFRAEHPAHRAGFHAAPAARVMGAGRELFARRKDGTEFPVEIGISPIQSPEGMLVLSVIVDISARKKAEAEEPQRIFEQFFSTKREGLGMGLAIARSIITSHGGELAAANARAAARACISRYRSSRRTREDEENHSSRRARGMKHVSNAGNRAAKAQPA
ncbi:MAG: PAS domain S-box protein [Chthoniobacterales bacterium]